MEDGESGVRAGEMATLHRAEEAMHIADEGCEGTQHADVVEQA